MKKVKFLTLMSFMLITSFAMSQKQKTDYRENLNFGVKIGANYSNVYDSEGEEFMAEGKLGLATGAFLSIPISKYFGIQPEVLLSQKGFKATGSILGRPYEIVRTSTYLDIPLFFSVKPSEFLTLQAGPQFSYLLKQKDSFTNTFLSYEEEQEFTNDNIRKNTLCFIVGGDINIKAIVVGARAG